MSVAAIASSIHDLATMPLSELDRRRRPPDPHRPQVHRRHRDGRRVDLAPARRPPCARHRRSSGLLLRIGLLRHAGPALLPRRGPAPTAPVQGAHAHVSRQRPLHRRAEAPRCERQNGQGTPATTRSRPEGRSHRRSSSSRRFLPFAPSPIELAPTLTTSYRRSTLLVGDDEGRATIDGDVTAVDESGRRIDLSHHMLIETKSNGHPTQLDRVLWQLHVRPIRISKYCTSLAALHADLPAHPWHRTLARLAPERCVA